MHLRRPAAAITILFWASAVSAGEIPTYLAISVSTTPGNPTRVPGHSA